MYYSAKAALVNNVRNRNDQVSTSYNKCLEILPSQVLLHSGQQQANRKCVNKKNGIQSDSCKRDFNVQANNIDNKNAHTAFKMSNSFPSFSTNNEQNSSGTYAENKNNSTFNTKNISSKNYLQNHKSVNKVVLETRNSIYKKCEKTPKLQHNVNQNRQELLKAIPNYLERSLGHDVDQKADKDPILCKGSSNDDKHYNENIMQNKDNKKEGKLDENVECYVNGSTRESREKTPMCLVNDLARFNKIPFQYRLTSEHGPAHCKRFTVTLKLGDEEYTAEGVKIKNAQHLAAKEAIEKTRYKHPIPKVNRRNDNEVTKINITPTVELNALAMKLGQQTYYILDSKQILSSENNQNSRMSQMSELISNYNGKQKKKSFDKCENPYSKLPQLIHKSKFNQLITLDPSYVSHSAPCKITLIVGNQKFFGVGKSPQQAKHDAATNALHVLKDQMSRLKTETHTESLNESGHKSPISLVFEIGIKRNLPVDFKVLREEGPAHMRTFTTACIVGNLLTEGEGTGKKLSKKKAAQKMIEELKKLPPLNSDTSLIKRTKIKGSSTKVDVFPTNSITDCKKNKKKNSETDSSNPITKVIKWHQNNNEKGPEFKLISESGKENSRRRQFVMEISTNKINARGIGNSKKLAKRDAAQNFLNAANRSSEVYSSKNEDLSNMQSECILDEKMDQGKSNLSSDDKTVVNKVKEANAEQRSASPVDKSLDFAEDSKSSNSLKHKDTISKRSGLHMKDQLLYLANLLGFDVDFSDYPKGNHNEFLTIVMLSTNPPQISHGVGINSEESQENASKNALKILSEMGLNNVAKS